MTPSRTFLLSACAALFLSSSSAHALSKPDLIHDRLLPASVVAAVIGALAYAYGKHHGDTGIDVFGKGILTVSVPASALLWAISYKNNTPDSNQDF